MEPLGKAFCLLAALGMVAGFIGFLRQQYIWHRWPVADGTVVASRLTTSKNDDGVTLCGASSRVQYSVAGTDYTDDDDEHVESSDCAGWKSKAASAKGAHVAVLYNPNDPKDVYVDPGYNLKFFGFPFWCLCFSIAFGLGGTVAWRLGRYMALHNIRLP